ncbi:unnamed protein product [Peronospora belbahrii]|uniref:Ubiquitin-like domain-containing protein n=1 Tax=Peronospora belbahrii TaxID=622444 RepID=A0ABN8CMS3_9STRA|nr:unnamed protein product [Peronospora belbahrii]
MTTLPIGMQLSDEMALDVEMDIDLDVFRPSAMSDTVDSYHEDWNKLYFDSLFQPDLGNNAQEDIDQMLWCESEEVALHSNHQHETAPGRECHCRNFAIQANRVQAQQEQIVETVAAKDQKKVLRHIFGSGKRLLGFGFEKEAVTDQSKQQENRMTDKVSTPALYVDEVMAAEHAEVVVTDMKMMTSMPVVASKQGVPSTPERVLLKSRSLRDDQTFSSPLHRSRVLSEITSPLSTTSFVSLESMMATPLSATSRSTAHPGLPMMRSLSPADELEKMASSGSVASMPKMSILRGNFQVSPGRETVSLVSSTAVLPPPYFREALDSPKKRRAYSKTFRSFAQPLSFSFANESSTDR